MELKDFLLKRIKVWNHQLGEGGQNEQQDLEIRNQFQSSEIMSIKDKGGDQYYPKLI